MEVDKYDYSKHPEAKKLRESKAASHVPAWQAEGKKAGKAAPPAPSKPKPKSKSTHRKKKPAEEKTPVPKKAEPPAPSARTGPAEGQAREQAQGQAVPQSGKSPAASGRKSGQRVVTTTKDTILSKSDK